VTKCEMGKFWEIIQFFFSFLSCVHVLKSTVECYYIASILKIMYIYKTVYSIYPFSMFTNIIRIFKMKNFLTVEINTH